MMAGTFIEMLEQILLVIFMVKQHIYQVLQQTVVFSAQPQETLTIMPTYKVFKHSQILNPLILTSLQHQVLIFSDHASLVEQTIDMVENDRADSLYIIDAPNVSTSDEVIDLLDTANIDSNYSTTYWPWIQIRDNENSAQLYLTTNRRGC